MRTRRPSRRRGCLVETLHGAAEAAQDDQTPAREWEDRSEAERQSWMQDTPLPDKDGTTPDSDAAADPDAVDWHAFVRESNFYRAGEGCQNRHTTRDKPVTAIAVSGRIDASGARRSSPRRSPTTTSWAICSRRRCSLTMPEESVENDDILELRGVDDPDDATLENVWIADQRAATAMGAARVTDDGTRGDRAPSKVDAARFAAR